MDERRQATSDSDASPPARPVLVRRIRETDLERLAVQLGTVAGNAFAAYSGVRRILKEQGLASSGDKSGDLAAKAKERAEQTLRATAERISAWRRSAWGKIADTDQGRHIQRSKQRTGQPERGYPLHVVLATGLVGAVLGTVLGVRKSHAR
jgi:hypothetical protein